MMWLRQSTASQEVLLGPFLDDTDGKTAETGLTIGNTDIKLWFEGGTTESNKNSGGATHIAGGRYYAVLDDTDTATLGKLEINVHVSGALPVRREFMVLPANVYDSMVLGTDYLQADAVQIEGTDATNQINAECDTAISDASLATAAALTTVDTVVDAIKAVTDNLPDSGALTTLDGKVDTIDGIVDSILEDTGTTMPGTLTTIEGKIDTVDGIVDDILLDTAEIGAAGAGLSAVPWNSAWDAEVQSECADAITAASLSAAGIADAVWDELVADHAGVGSTGAALAAAGGSGDPWSTAVPGAYGAGTAGYLLGTYLDAPISTVDTVVDAIKAVTDNLPDSGALTTIDGIVEAILVDTGTTLPATLTTMEGKIDTVGTVVDAILVDTGTDIPASIAALNDLSAAEVNAQVVDVIRTDTATELGAVPAASPALHTMVQWVYQIHRNKLTSTATASTVSNDAGTTIGTSTDSDDGTTFTRGEFA